MTWRLDADGSRLLRRGGTLLGARLVFVDDGEGRRVFIYTRPRGMTAAAFRALLLGAGTVQEPQGEAGAWIAEFNAPGTTEGPLE